MTDNVLIGTLKPTHLVTHSLAMNFFVFAFCRLKANIPWKKDTVIKPSTCHFDSDAEHRMMQF